MSLNMIFLGPPGTGKGAISQHIAANKGFIQVSTGDIIREEIASGSEFGVELKKLYDAGKFAPDAFTAKILEKKLASLVSAKDFKGVILDGFPRNLIQADLLEGIFSRLKQKLGLVVYIESSEENVVDRICARVTCPKCKRIYNLKMEGVQPKVNGVCDDDGATLVQRADDKEEVVRERFQTYLKQTAPLIEYYKKKGVLESYDGNPPFNESLRRAMEIIDKHLGK